jgi:hypothetical protein
MGGFKKQNFFRFFKYFLQKTKNFNDFLKDGKILRKAQYQERVFQNLWVWFKKY